MTFLGKNIGITEVTISGTAGGARLGFALNFTDDDGIIHATVRHSIDPTVDPATLTAVTTLMDTVKAWAQRTHFDTASAEKVAVNGILESIGVTDSDDDVGIQG